MSYDTRITDYLNQMIGHTHELVELLKAEAEFFKQNDIASMEANNQKKHAVNQLIGELVQNMQNLPSLMLHPGTVFEKIAQCAKTLSTVERNQLEDLQDKLTGEIGQYDNMMRINRQVINANLTFIKDLFFTLVNNKEEPPATYGRTGVLEKI
jgi:flagellar biosynthesis/type III secretory pathway chaperone